MTKKEKGVGSGQSPTNKNNSEQEKLYWQAGGVEVDPAGWERKEIGEGKSPWSKKRHVNIQPGTYTG